ncbi:hypothetical protein LZ023_29995 [Pseudomonas silvicola]|nr:hypothetical protein LZ023_29995 [Pseudomonas silvicola]
MVKTSQAPHEGVFSFFVQNEQYQADQIYFGQVGDEWNLAGVAGTGSRLHGVLFTFPGPGTGTYPVKDISVRFVTGGHHVFAEEGQFAVRLTPEGVGSGTFHFSVPNLSGEVHGDFNLGGPGVTVLPFTEDVRRLFEG